MDTFMVPRFLRTLPRNMQNIGEYTTQGAMECPSLEMLNTWLDKASPNQTSELAL